MRRFSIRYLWFPICAVISLCAIAPLCMSGIIKGMSPAQVKALDSYNVWIATLFSGLTLVGTITIILYQRHDRRRADEEKTHDAKRQLSFDLYREWHSR